MEGPLRTSGRRLRGDRPGFPARRLDLPMARNAVKAAATLAVDDAQGALL